MLKIHKDASFQSVHDHIYNSFWNLITYAVRYLYKSQHDICLAGALRDGGFG